MEIGAMERKMELCVSDVSYCQDYEFAIIFCTFTLYFHFVLSLCIIILYSFTLYHLFYYHFEYYLFVFYHYGQHPQVPNFSLQKSRKTRPFLHKHIFSIWRKIIHETYGLWNYWTILLTEQPVEIVFTDELKNINYWLTHWLT